jgi:hypothetical protein
MPNRSHSSRGTVTTQELPTLRSCVGNTATIGR